MLSIGQEVDYWYWTNIPPSKEVQLRRMATGAPRFSAKDAAQALHVLIGDGKLAVRDVASALKRREAMIRELRGRLATLEAGVAATVGTVERNVARKVRRKPKLSAATRAKYRQQGRYLAAVRRLSKNSRAKVKAIREKAGVRAAIAAAKTMAK